MKLDWERVRLLIWLRRRQVQHAHARHGRGWWAGLQHLAIFGFAAIALIAGLAAGYSLLKSETAALLAWDTWAVLVCYLWLSALAAEAQRADPIDAGRLLHLPVSMREAFVLNFAASLYNVPNIIGLAGALGLIGGSALHTPGAFAVLPVAVLFLLAVSAWAQVLRSWFLKVFRNPRRRRWLSIVAGLILALAGQLPNLLNLLNMQFNRSYLGAVEADYGARKVEGKEETYDPVWATLPPGTVFDSDNITIGSDTPNPRIYVMPDKREYFRVTYAKSTNLPPGSYPLGTVVWRARYWQVREGAWRRAMMPPRDLFRREIVEAPGETVDPITTCHTRATENLEGVPADLRDLWPPNQPYQPQNFLRRFEPGSAILGWHAAVPPGWPAWVAVGSKRGNPAIPLFAGVAGLLALTSFGILRAWHIQRDAVLMTEKVRPGKPAAMIVASRWSPASDKSASLARPLAGCSPSVSGLARAFLRQWARSVEIRFQIIVACGLAGGAVGFGFFLWWTERSTAGAFHVVSSIVGLTMLAFMGLFINFFGYDRAACRAMILAPVSASDVLLGKNAAIARLVMWTSLPFVAAAAVISGEWLMCTLAWILLAPAAVLLCLALGNSSSVANPAPIQLGQRAQARPESGIGNGCLHLLLYLSISLVLQIPQLLVAASGSLWVGVVSSGVVLAGSLALWRYHFKGQCLRLEQKFPDVADAVGKATDM